MSRPYERGGDEVYAMYYNRLTGWLWFALGALGLTRAPTGDYIHLTTPETGIALAAGCLGMLGARVTRRNQVVVCGILLLVYVAWLWLGASPRFNRWMSTTPLESVLRLLEALWALYCLAAELWGWRTRRLSVAEP
ncbi:MAG: hypothetical protein K6T76_00230 [Alicyclobacillus mali]|uniref:hypothetical protein n=1 Tax=Alicyclobacillus mali (ex Roth et al. 2021) TaxID=1123961 RepID=UPI0023F0A5DE|nr:hypothetical protein [Alicyclobacillus mali (ex Roth et al. 2021)]MCL6487354.1 hypothetical protein [Alicyclobacillus mali (ex Roth et al. 2021)]